MRNLPSKAIDFSNLNPDQLAGKRCAICNTVWYVPLMMANVAGVNIDKVAVGQAVTNGNLIYMCIVHGKKDR